MDKFRMQSQFAEYNLTEPIRARFCTKCVSKQETWTELGSYFLPVLHYTAGGPMTKLTDTQHAEVSSFLNKHTTLTIATLDPDAQPQAASLFYVSDDALNLYWISDEKSRHSQNLERFSRMSAAIHNETWDWRDIQGLQINGQARRLVAADEIDRAWMLFRDKFPFASEFADRISQSSFYICSPKWIRWIDNSKGFGHREEFNLS